MDRLSFGLHGDLYLSLEERVYNLGYASHTRIPAVLRLFVLRASGKDLLDGVPLGELPRTDEALAMEVQEFSSLECRMRHLSDVEFADALSAIGRFYDGGNRGVYDWSLGQGMLRLHYKGKRIHSLDVDGAERFFRAYWEFLLDDPRLGAAQGEMRSLCSGMAGHSPG